MQYDFWGVFGSAEFNSRLKLDVPSCVDRLDRPEVPILRSHPIKKGETLTFPIYHINFHAIWLWGGSWVRRVQCSAQIRCTRLRWPSGPAGGPDFEVKSNKKGQNLTFLIHHINFHAIWLLGGSWVCRVQFLAQIRCTRLPWPSGLAGGPDFEVKSNKKRSKPNFSHIPHKFPCNMTFRGFLGPQSSILGSN